MDSGTETKNQETGCGDEDNELNFGHIEFEDLWIFPCGAVHSVFGNMDRKLRREFRDGEVDVAVNRMDL